MVVPPLVSRELKVNQGCDYLDLDNHRCILIDVDRKRPSFGEGCVCSDCRMDLLEMKYNQVYKLTEEGRKAVKSRNDQDSSKKKGNGLHRPRGALETANSYLQSIIDGLDSPVMVIGNDHRIMMMNRSCHEFAHGKVKKDGVLYCYQVSHTRDRPCDGTDHPCLLDKVKESGETVTVVHEHRRSDGEMRFVEITASPLWGPDGSFQGIIETSREIIE